MLCPDDHPALATIELPCDHRYHVRCLLLYRHFQLQPAVSKVLDHFVCQQSEVAKNGSYTCLPGSNGKISWEELKDLIEKHTNRLSEDENDSEMTPSALSGADDSSLSGITLTEETQPHSANRSPIVTVDNSRAQSPLRSSNTPQVPNSPPGQEFASTVTDAQTQPAVISEPEPVESQEEGAIPTTSSNVTVPPTQSSLRDTPEGTPAGPQQPGLGTIQRSLSPKMPSLPELPQTLPETASNPLSEANSVPPLDVGLRFTQGPQLTRRETQSPSENASEDIDLEEMAQKAHEIAQYQTDQYEQNRRDTVEEDQDLPPSTTPQSTVAATTPDSSTRHASPSTASPSSIDDAIRTGEPTEHVQTETPRSFPQTSPPPVDQSPTEEPIGSEGRKDDKVEEADGGAAADKDTSPPETNTQLEHEASPSQVPPNLEVDSNSEPPAEEPPATEPPAAEPPAVEPPAEDPPAEEQPHGTQSLDQSQSSEAGIDVLAGQKQSENDEAATSQDSARAAGIQPSGGEAPTQTSQGSPPAVNETSETLPGAFDNRTPEQRARLVSLRDTSSLNLKKLVDLSKFGVQSEVGRSVLKRTEDTVSAFRKMGKSVKSLMNTLARLRNPVKPLPTDADIDNAINRLGIKDLSAERKGHL